MLYLLKKKINRKLKEFKENFKYMRFYKGHEPVLLLELRSAAKVRTYLNLIFRLREHYKQPIVIEFSLFRYFLLAKWFKELDFIYFSNPLKKQQVYRRFGQFENADFKVSFEYKKVYQSKGFIEEGVPYIMHPANYTIIDPEILEKQIGIILSGNFDPKIYDSDLITKNFQLLNRWQIYNELIKNPFIAEITGRQLIEKMHTNIYLDKVVLMQWQKGAIATEEWRSYLSSAKFIFCAPGMTMPMCHNVIEAMSVGVVPILNYQNWLNPSLTDQENCLVFKSTQDIIKVIDTALKMDAITYGILQQKVILYYDTYYKKYDFEKNRFKTLILLNEDINDLI